MKRELDDDLFKESTMTFGEHLEELRVHLFKAVIGLAIGFAIGLLVGKYVVAIIQAPLKDALEEHIREKAKDDFLVKYGREPNANELDLIDEKHLVYEEVYLDAAGLGKAIEVAADPETLAAGSVGPSSVNTDPSGNLVPMLIWRKTADYVRVTTLSATEAFMIWMKAALLTGAVLSAPYVFYQLWMFVAAGLYPHEKKYVHIFLPFSVALFMSGAGLAFFFVFKPVLHFLFGFNRSLGIDPDPRISEWLSFVLFMPLGFGVSFQLPLVMLFLQRIGIFNTQQYLSQWRIAVLVIFVLAAILTPSPDPYSMLLLAAPLTVLFFGGVLLCKKFPSPATARR